MELNNQILEARKTLRGLYKNYARELYDITKKIDKYLEELQYAKTKETEQEN